MSTDESHDDQTQSFVALTPGTAVSHYRIIKRIGAGGMGEVYLAQDSRLDRQVALKFLPAHLCQDEACRLRFKREAQAVAKLDHPNIIHVYEVDEFQGRPYFAMQHVEGRSLSEYVAETELPLEQIHRLGIQMGEGLQAAHEHGVIHRDIKPANVLVDAHGRVKIVDFGLASVAGADQLTKTGSTLGTASYMSPEQVQGRTIDRRSDLFSLGVVLYELITKQNPFKRDHEAATLEAILTDEPEPLARYKSGTTDTVQRIIDKALSKDPSTRYQHADDLVADLRREHVDESASSRMTGRARRRRPPRARLGLAIAAAAMIVVAVGLVVVGYLDRSESPVVASQRQVTFHGDVGLAEISPDGTYFVYTRQSDSDQALYMQDLAGGESLELLRWSSFWDVRMSPDGSEIAVAGFPEVHSGYGTYILPRFGGPLRRVSGRMCSDLCIDWSPVSPHLALQESCLESHRDSISLINLESGEVRNVPLRIPFQWCYSVCWLKEGERFAISTESESENALWAVDIAGNSPVKVLDGRISNVRRSVHKDRIYCLKDHAESHDLLRVSLDLATGARSGTPVTLLSGQQMTGFSVSADNRRLLYNKETRSSNLWLVTLSAPPDSSVPPPRQITKGTGLHQWPTISPDGNHIAYCDGQGQVWVMPILGGKANRVSYSGFRHAAPAWSPDGREIVTSCTYDSLVYTLAINSVSGGESRRLEEAIVPPGGGFVCWLPDRTMIFQQPGMRDFVLLDPVTGSQTSFLGGDTLGWLHQPIVSPHGDLMAVMWNRRGGNRGLWTISLLDSAKTQLWPGWLFPIRWSDSDNSIFVVFPDETDPGLHAKHVSRINVDTRAVDTICTIPFDLVGSVSITPDGQRLVCEVISVQKDLWLVENFDPEIK